MNKSILVIDDDRNIDDLLKRFLEQSRFDVWTAMNLAEARKNVADRTFDAFIIDHILPDGKGTDLIEEIRSQNPDAAIVIITGAADVPLAVDAMRRGADNFLMKPIRLGDLLVFLQKALDVVSLRRTVKARTILQKGIEMDFGTSSAMGRVLEVARLAVESDHPVLITGETGVGKGVLARWIHENSSRREGALVDVECPIFRGELLRSELYGHARGSFTTAVQDQPGLLEAADGGTLFLDEIGEMDLSLQVQFLKVIEEKFFRRVGEVRVRRSDFRLICATNKDLDREAAEGRFRTDLLFRIKVLPIHIPPLRERQEDILSMARHFLAECRYGYRDLTGPVAKFLLSYAWPGNIRELKYVVERAVLLARGNELDIDHFTGLWDPQSRRADTEGNRSDGADEEYRSIRDALRDHGNDVAASAKALGMSRATLYRRMKKLNIPTT